MKLAKPTKTVLNRLQAAARCTAFQVVCMIALGPLSAAVAADQLAAGSDVAPDFALRSTSGDNRRLSEYRGQVVVLGFWARWCGDCRQAMKALDQLDKKYQKAGLITFGIDIDDTVEQAAAMAQSLGLGFPVLLDDRKTASNLFNLKTMPLIVLIDREGRQRYRHTSFEIGDEVRIGNELRSLVNE